MVVWMKEKKCLNGQMRVVNLREIDKWKHVKERGGNEDILT